MLRVQGQNKFISPDFMADWRHPVYQTLTQKDPCYPRNVICKPYLLSLICIPMQVKLNKSPLREKLEALLLWEIGHLSFPSRPCLGRFILIYSGQESSAGWSYPTVEERVIEIIEPNKTLRREFFFQRAYIFFRFFFLIYCIFPITISPYFTVWYCGVFNQLVYL